MARPGPKSKKGKAAPKSKKVEEKEPEVIESEEEEVKDDVVEENNGSAEDAESEEEEPPAKKGKGRPKTPAKKTPAKKGGRSSSRGRKVPAKKKAESESEEDETEYEVHSILEERHRKGVTEYKVRWKGYAAKSATWEPASNLSCDDAIEEFKKKKEEAKNAPTKSLREAPKKADRYVDVAGHGGEHRMRHSKRGAGTLGKSPRKNYREEDSD